METNFTYNGTKLNTITVEGIRIEHFYTGDNITKIKRYNGVSLELETIYDYDNQGRVSSEFTTFYLNDFLGKVVYAYNDDQTITFQEYFGSSNPPTNLGDTGTIEKTSSGEISQIETYNQSAFSRRQTNTYDAKNSIFKNITGYDKLPRKYAKFHNQLTTNSYNSANELESNSTFEYNYNTNDFPTNCTQLFYQNGNVVNTVQITYFY
ncbi:hypothetical protein [Flavobacterium sp. SM2513]|uniref:hypothetical protein n=1 Tax=Flavobacterium sp. SM2513 TaxID=3424766 RepID=UPI003D7F9050